MSSHARRRRRCAITGTSTALGDRSNEVEVVARPGALAIDRGQQDLAGASRSNSRPRRPARGRFGVARSRPHRRVARAASRLTSMDAITAWLPKCSASRVMNDGSSNACELTTTFSKPMPEDGTGPARTFGCRRRRPRGMKHSSAISREELEVRLAAVRGRRDVEEHQLVDLELVEDADGVARVADVCEAAEPHRLHQALVAEQQRRDDAWPQHVRASRSSRAAACRTGGSSPDGTARRRCSRASIAAAKVDAVLGGQDRVARVGRSARSRSGRSRSAPRSGSPAVSGLGRVGVTHVPSHVRHLQAAHRPGSGASRRRSSRARRSRPPRCPA